MCSLVTLPNNLFIHSGGTHSFKLEDSVKVQRESELCKTYQTESNQATD